MSYAYLMTEKIATYTVNNVIWISPRNEMTLDCSPHQTYLTKSLPNKPNTNIIKLRPDKSQKG